ncbi:hypothetical protein [Streptomyces sp. NPDC048496]
MTSTFTKEQHGTCPEHCATRPDGTVLELTPPLGLTPPAGP